MNGTSPPSSAKDIRPGVAFRIGIVGHRQIADEQSIISATSTVIAAVGKELASIAEAPEIACRYRISDRQVGTIHVMSGLAEGADQICALAALAEHDPRKFSVQLTAVLPCDANTFAAGFSGSQANRWREMFTQVLNRARGSFVLDGDPSRTDFTLAYEAVARTIVLNSDLLLAVWNGKDGGGWGGTQSSVQLALDRHVPVLWVRMSEASSGSDAEFSLVASRSDLSLAFDRQQSQASSLNAVRHLVRRTIVFPIAPEEQAPSHLKSTPPITAWIEKSAAKLVRKNGPEAAVTAFLRGDDPSSNSRLPIPDIHALLQSIYASTKTESDAPPETGRVIDDSLFDRAFVAADRDAVAHAKRDRAAIATSIAFGTFAALIAVAGLALPTMREDLQFVADNYGSIKALLLALEFTILVYILAVVYSVRTRALTEAWLGKRLLAELLRTAPYLYQIGRNLRLTSEMGGAHAAGAIAPWVIWYHNAIVRHQGLAVASHAHAEFKRKALTSFAEEIVARQLEYNRHTHRANHAIAHGLEWLGELLFVATLTLLALKAVLIAIHAPEAIIAGTTALTIAFPILSAGLLALRELGGFLNVERRSEYMTNELVAAAETCRQLIEKIESGTPLVSLEIGVLEERIAWQLVGDAANWAALFETKNPVAG